MARSRANEFFDGVRSELPLLLGVFPFGLIYGVTALQANLEPIMAQGMSSIVFAGASQLMITQLIANGTPNLLIILTAFVINLRHMLYSASMAPYFKQLSPWWKLILGYLLTDEAYSVVITHYLDSSNQLFKHWFMAGAGFTLWAGWQISSACGIFLGTQISPTWSLDFAVPLVFIALLIPLLKDRAGLAAAAAGGIISVLAFGLPFKLGIMLAALIGIFVGLLIEGQ